MWKKSLKQQVEAKIITQEQIIDHSKELLNAK
jgi:hypothetical protein